jgi:predicted dehydrogenase
MDMSQDTIKPLRVGVIGAGRFGRLHARTLTGLAEAELVALVDRDPAGFNGLPEELSGTAQWTDMDDAIDRSGAQAWVVASSTASHVTAAAKVLESGLPVLLEKPIATDLQSAESLAPLIGPGSCNFMMGHLLLFSAEFQGLQREIEARGPAVLINSVRHRPARTIDEYPGESPLRLLMVHDLYMTLVMTKGAEPTRFHCTRHRRGEGITDLTVVALQWSGGGTASLIASFLTPDGMADDGYDRLEVFGEGWAARACLNPRPLELWDDRARYPMGHDIRLGGYGPDGMMAAQARHFCKVARGDAQVPVGARYEDAIQIERWLMKLEDKA